jgi:hypothetical protein
MSDVRDCSQDGPKRLQRWWFGPPLILVAILYVLPLAGSAGATNPNEVARIELSTSIAFSAHLDIGSAAEFYGLSEDVSIRNGKIYSDKAPGLSLIAAPVMRIVSPLLPRAPSSDLPAYWPLRHFLTMVLVALPAVGLAFLIGAAVPDQDPSKRTSFAVIAALATPLWTYSTEFFGHVPSALLVTLAWFTLLGFPGRRVSLSAGQAALGGAAAGFAVSTEYPTVLIVVVIFATLLLRRTTFPILAYAIAGAIAGAIPALLYHQLAFGAPWITGYGLKAHGDFQAIHEQGILGVSLPKLESLWGVLFSARRGMLFYCPLLLLMPVGLWRMVEKRGWRDAGPILMATAAYVLFAAGFVDWPAGWCAAARHLIPIVPLVAAIALFGAAGLSEHRWGAAIVVILITVSGANALLSIALTPYFPPEFGAPLAQLVLPSLADGAGFSNLLSSAIGVAPTVVVLLIGLIVIAALIWAAGRVVHDHMIWRSIISLTTVAVVLLIYSWQGSTPKVETEVMRSEVLRRLGHTAVADRIDDSIRSAAIPTTN